jgi:hypothetical protein
MLLERLRRGSEFNDAEMLRLDRLPVGVARPRG